MQESKISVIIPVYNAGKYLCKCLDSVINQTYGALEIILVNDKSTDNSLEICCEYAAKDERIIVVDSPVNQGPGCTRNTGLEHASGQYVAFLDSDDWFAPDHIEALYTALRDKNADMVTAGNTRCNNDGDVTGVNELPFYGCFSGGDVKKKILLSFIAPDDSAKNDLAIPVGVCFSIYRMDIIKQNNLRFVSEKDYLSEDLFFNLYYLPFVERACLIKDFGYFYRFNPVSVSKGFDVSKIQRVYNYYDMLKKTKTALGLEKIIGYRIERSTIARIRSTLMLICRSDISRKNKLGYIKSILNHDVTKQVLNDYPIGNYRTSLKIAAYLMKKRYTFLTYLLFMIKESQRKKDLKK